MIISKLKSKSKSQIEKENSQIRELKQDIRLLHTEESQIGFQSWVTNACDQVRSARMRGKQ